MILPLLAVAAPRNLKSVEMVDADVHQREAVVGRVKHSHAVRIIGREDDLAVANAVAAPLEFTSLIEMVELMSTSVKLLSVGSNTPTPSASKGRKDDLAVARSRSSKRISCL